MSPPLPPPENFNHTQHFSPGNIQFQLVYDRGQCADSSYLNQYLGWRTTLNSGFLHTDCCFKSFNLFDKVEGRTLAIRKAVAWKAVTTDFIYNSLK